MLDIIAVIWYIQEAAQSEGPNTNMTNIYLDPMKVQQRKYSLCPLSTKGITKWIFPVCKPLHPGARTDQLYRNFQ